MGSPEEKAAKKARKEAKRAAKASEESESNAGKRSRDSEDLVEESSSKKSKKEKKEKSDKKDKKEKKSKKDKKDSRDEKERMEAVLSSVSSASTSSSSSHKHAAGGSGNAKSAGGANLYVPHDATVSLSSSKVDSYRKEVDIVVLPEEEAITYKPMLSFDHLYPSIDTLGLCPEIKKYIEHKGFTKPSPIQSQCWPPMLSGRDVIGIAATGSGKTLSFLIPALLKIANKNKRGIIQMLVMAPTRELAMQSDVVCKEVSKMVGHGEYAARSVCIYGGVSKGEQKAAIRSGIEIVVATPGRLKDLVDDESLSLSQVHYLVLDEADRMLDEGFEPVIKDIVSRCPTASQGRQTVMFSATWPEEIRRLASTYLKPDVVRIVVGGDELSANHRVTQIVECIDKFARDRQLIELLKKYHDKKNRCLIFVLYKREATVVLNNLLAKGFNAGAIHGDKAQADRTAALEAFKTGEVPLLIATDVAARGLDIPQVEYVLNYSFPLTVEDYVHRIGRTGRGGRTGISHTFFTDDDKGLAGALVGVLQQAKQEVPQSIYKYPLLTKKKTDKLYGDFGPKADLVGKTATKITFDD